MKILEIETDRHLRLLTDDKPSPSWLDDETLRWVAAWDCKPGEADELCRECGIELPPQASEILARPPAHPLVVGLESLVLVDFQVGSGGDARRIQALCTPSTILTFHQAGGEVEDFEQNCLRGRRLRCSAPIAVLLGLIEMVGQQLGGGVFSLREKLVALSDELEAETRELDPGEHLALKQEAGGLEIQAEDLLYCMAELAKVDSEAVEPAAIRPLALQQVADLDRGLQAVGRLKNRLGDLHQLEVQRADETTNRRLKILTVLSAIYMPPTLIAGIYGMNFTDIPISNIPHGYIGVMAIMVAIVVGQLVFFYRNGWFK